MAPLLQDWFGRRLDSSNLRVLQSGAESGLPVSYSPATGYIIGESGFQKRWVRKSGTGLLVSRNAFSPHNPPSVYKIYNSTGHLLQQETEKYLIRYNPATGKVVEKKPKK